MRKEIIGIFLLFFVLLIFISLLSYSPADPSINHSVPKIH
ncbi:MAG: DNA translocase FtsK 4TM domain-containing protein, partial [Deltaproteobacteria bacterium]|nr:DNA translocase FtsK 4TM domain-containing protein [Deltaproteobacteria bacterium]